MGTLDHWMKPRVDATPATSATLQPAEGKSCKVAKVPGASVPEEWMIGLRKLKDMPPPKGVQWGRWAQCQWQVDGKLKAWGAQLHK